MNISTLNLFFKDALKNIRRNAGISIISITSITIVSFILGIFLILLLNIKVGITGVNPQLEIQVFLNNNIKTADQQNIYNKIKTSNGINNINFQSKKQILASLKKRLGDSTEDVLINSENNNPIQESYTVKVDSPNDIPNITYNLNCLKGIKEIDNNQDIAKKLSSIIKVVQWIGTPVFLIFSVISIFLIENTIKLAIYSRREEITIIKYIGATDWFIICPFVFEGMIVGFLGSASGIAALYLLYNFAYRKIAYYSIEIFIRLISPVFIFTTLSWIFIFIGIIVSAVISIFATKKFLVV